MEKEYSFMEAAAMLRDGKCLGIKPANDDDTLACIRLFKPGWTKDGHLIRWFNDEQIAISIDQLFGNWILVKDEEQIYISRRSANIGHSMRLDTIVSVTSLKMVVECSKTNREEVVDALIQTMFDGMDVMKLVQDLVVEHSEELEEILKEGNGYIVDEDYYAGLGRTPNDAKSMLITAVDNNATW